MHCVNKNAHDAEEKSEVCCRDCIHACFYYERFKDEYVCNLEMFGAIGHSGEFHCANGKRKEEV